MSTNLSIPGNYPLPTPQDMAEGTEERKPWLDNITLIHPLSPKYNPELHKPADYLLNDINLGQSFEAMLVWTRFHARYFSGPPGKKTKDRESYIRDSDTYKELATLARSSWKLPKDESASAGPEWLMWIPTLKKFGVFSCTRNTWMGTARILNICHTHPDSRKVITSITDQEQALPHTSSFRIASTIPPRSKYKNPAPDPNPLPQDHFTTAQLPTEEEAREAVEMFTKPVEDELAIQKDSTEVPDAIK